MAAIVFVVFDPRCCRLAQEKADKKPRSPDNQEKKQERCANETKCERVGQNERVKQYQDVHRQQRSPHFPEPLDEDQQDDDGNDIHQSRDVDRRGFAEPICQPHHQLIRVHVPLPFPVAPNSNPNETSEAVAKLNLINEQLALLKGS